jgi:gas vesicle protein
MSTRTNAAIALAALAAGAAIGILFAPASGKETRSRITRKGNDLRDSLNDMLAEGSELIDQLKGEAGDLAAKGKDAANNMKDRVKDAASEMAGSARSSANGGFKG